MQRISVIITNYNYARFVGAAIDSALALDWDDVEVVVSDDGSTDDSRRVVESYGERVLALWGENGSQRVAANRGFAASTGDVVIFLDADDLLPPDLPRHLERVWGSTVSKVQLQMQRIDAKGQPLGRPFPSYEPVPTPAQVRRWARVTSAYPTPPGSGNVYARWFAQRLFPVGPELGAAADSALLAAAPFLGDVVSLHGVCVGYRQHDTNDSHLLSDRTRFVREIVRAQDRWTLVRHLPCDASAGLDERPLDRSRELLQFRVAARRSPRPGSPPPHSGFGKVLRDTLLAPFWPGPEPWSQRVLVSAWCLAILLAPARAVNRLLVLRFTSAS
ncbi:glycosyltransferase family 2 protein [Lapillicoccus sp.]|uniref:glycosyltransferase family 2 protein n=1 Tax=Lapillicoccus sp. TaxID=1909287 RepID=UPI0025F805B1|nr:glycosyltransferase family 2 protein [Lapillicoccus sp.]